MKDVLFLQSILQFSICEGQESPQVKVCSLGCPIGVKEWHQLAGRVGDQYAWLLPLLPAGVCSQHSASWCCCYQPAGSMQHWAPTGGSCETGVGSRQSSAVMLPVLLLCAPCNLDVEILPINTMLLKDKGAIKPNLVFRFKPLGWLQKMYLIEDQ